MPRPALLGSGRPLRPVAAAVVLVAASAVLFSGCTAGDPQPTSTAAPQPGTPGSTEGAQTPAPVPTETAEPAVPFEISCDALLTADQLYAFNPNFGADPAHVPAARPVVAVVEEQAGTACGYLNQTSAEVIEVAVATPSAAALVTLANDAAATSSAVPTYGTPPDVTGFFTRSGEHGQVQVFSGPYWVVLDSTAIFEPGDAQTLVADVLANLPAS
ncbi:iron ABC transporter ATP-binding protein [Agromyces salentinus]|uniref:Iron ABC transporter ATP-binding protein n=1 Tax=Agromyces salentinus TaxID=269421 RepID=A0ABN2MX90_9MICO|nr:iron ABC transporter ATP-binding protein [Agromyces salentinus]